MAKKPKEIKEPMGFEGGEMLATILRKELAALTNVEIDILRARRSYLTKDEIKRYELDKSKVEEAEIIDETVEEEKPTIKITKK